MLVRRCTLAIEIDSGNRRGIDCREDIEEVFQVEWLIELEPVEDDQHLGGAPPRMFTVAERSEPLAPGSCFTAR
jgi:hypothetical protein